LVTEWERNAWVCSSFLGPPHHSLLIILGEKLTGEVLAEWVQRLVVRTAVADDPLDPNLDFVVVGQGEIGGVGRCGEASDRAAAGAGANANRLIFEISRFT